MGGRREMAIVFIPEELNFPTEKGIYMWFYSIISSFHHMFGRVCEDVTLFNSDQETSNHCT